jgi:UDP-N-acetylglucosamine---dolichyl-phosphate N-acetylglucosaminyltransferase
MKVFIVLPAYNEEASIVRVLDALRKEGYHSLIVVDDGSADRTAQGAQEHGADVYRHAINRGLGGALGTGISAALDAGADIIVTFDADGQHNPKDIKRLIVPIQKHQADVVIGSRLLNPRGMPLIRRIGNRGLNIITWVLFGIWTTDSQSGLRAFSRTAAERISIKTNRMEVSSEIIKEIGRNNLRLREVAIKPIYTEYSMQHGQKHSNAVKIVAKLIIERLRR